MRGILLAGGAGSRLYPSTKAISKQLLPVYDKPMLFYPLSILMLAAIREVLVISSPRDLGMIETLLGDGADLGMRFSYLPQREPRGIAEALIIGEEFCRREPVCLILGDNLFFGHELPRMLESASQLNSGARIFAYRVQDPERYGVVEFGADGQAMSLEEKPAEPRSPWAVTGLYFYDGQAAELARTLRPSVRGELEITDLNKIYLQKKMLKVTNMGRGIAWLDTGTPDALLQSSLFVQTVELRQGLKVACLEEIAFIQKFISLQQLSELAEKAPPTTYGQYLRTLAESEKSINMQVHRRP